jgi:hypothetical protein
MNPNYNPLSSLVAFLEKEYEEQSKRFELMKNEGVITFESLQFLFTRGLKFFGVENGYKVGAEVLETAYTRTLFTTLFVVTGEVIKSNGEKFYCHNHQFVVPSFKGIRRIDELEVQPMDDATLEHLKARGKKFNQLGVGAHYQTYKGSISYKTQFYTTHWKADGRVMLDGNSFNKMNPDYRYFNNFVA